MTGCPSRSSCPPAARGRPGAELADSLSMAFLVLLEASRRWSGRCWYGGGQAQAIGKPLARR